MQEQHGGVEEVGEKKELFKEGQIIDKLGTLNEWSVVDNLLIDSFKGGGGEAIFESTFTEMVNPFYSCVIVNGKLKPLPIAINEGNTAAIAFRDKWLTTATEQQKEYCGYNKELKNFIGGAEGEQLKASDA